MFNDVGLDITRHALAEHHEMDELVEKLEGALPVIGVGGITDGETAAEKVKAGAALVQVYTGFIYKGPALLRKAARLDSRASLHRDAVFTTAVAGRVLRAGEDISPDNASAMPESTKSSGIRQRLTTIRTHSIQSY